MLFYKCASQCIAGWQIAGGGITGQMSLHLYTADQYKRFFLAIDGVGSITGVVKQSLMVVRS